MAIDYGDMSQQDIADLDALQKASSASSLSGDHGDMSQEDIDNLNALNNLPSKPSSSPSVSPTVSKAVPQARSRFAQTARPTPTQKATPAPSWSEAFSQGAQNLLPSAKEQIMATGSALMHPQETLSNIGQIGKGAVSKIAGALGVEQNKQEKAKTEKMFDLLADHYSMYTDALEGNSEKLRKAIAQDPASVLMDASLALTGGSSLAAKAAGEASTVGKLAGAVGKASQYLDPTQAALKTAQGVGSLAASVPRGAAAVLSKVPVSAQKMISEAYSTADAAKKSAFADAFNGKVTPTDTAMQLEKAGQAVKKEASNNYLSQKKNLMFDTSQPINPATGQHPIRQIDFSKMYQDLAAADQKASLGSALGPSQDRDALRRIRDMLDDLQTHPDPMKRSLENVDALKQQIYKLHNEYGPNARSAINDMYHSVRDTLADSSLGGDKGYSNLMENYQSKLNDIADIKNATGVGGKGAPTAKLIKSLKALRGPNGKNGLQLLAEKDPTIPYALAGHAASEWLPGHMQSLYDVGAAAAAHALSGGNPLAGIGTIAASSPRLVGYANIGAGKLGRGMNLLGKASPALNLAERSAEANAPEPSDSDSGAGNFDSSFNWLINHEGENYDVDSNGYGAKFGINEAAHPEVDVPNLTRDQAKEIYKRQYWDPIGGDALNEKNPKLALAAFDMAATAGPQVAKRILEESQGDLNKFFDLRQKYLDSINEEKLNKGRATVGQIRDSWNRRAQDIMRAASGGRIERASGGRVDHVDRLVNHLMNQFKVAKKATDQTTEPLLNAPDEAIVKALSVANQAI